MLQWSCHSASHSGAGPCCWLGNLCLVDEYHKERVQWAMSEATGVNSIQAAQGGTPRWGRRAGGQVEERVYKVPPPAQ